jgi:hypothetical protein
MIVYHKNHEIDREQWDNCVRNSPGVKPYAFSWYLDIMAPGWEALVDDDYDSVFPIPCSEKFGVKYVATPVFLQQVGAFSPDKPSENSVIEFLDYLPDFYKLVDLSIGQNVVYDGYKITERVNYELDLSKHYDKLWENFSTHCKRNVEASSRKKPELVDNVKPEELIDLFILNRGKEIKGIKVYDYQRLKNLMDFCLKNKKGRIIGVRGTRRRPLFGMFVVETPGSKVMLFVVNTPQSREKRMGYYVVNELVREFATTKTVLDFAGSSIPDIASFMASFGSVINPFYRIYRNRLLWPVRMLK